MALIFTSLALVMIMEQTMYPERTKLGDLVLERSSPVFLFQWIYVNSPYLATSSWILFVFALIWKGTIRSIWSRNGYDYDTFKLFVKMRGSPTRVRILQNLFVPKNRSQLANECGVDWKAIARHVDTLIKHNFIKEIIMYGNARYLMITDEGKKVLELLNNNQTNLYNE